MIQVNQHYVLTRNMRGKIVLHNPERDTYLSFGDSYFWRNLERAIQTMAKTAGTTYEIMKSCVEAL